MRLGNIFWGLLIVLLGVVLLGTQVGWWSHGIWNDLFRFWPLLLIALGLRLILADGPFTVFAVMLFAAVIFGLIYGPRTLGTAEVLKGNPWFNLHNEQMHWSFGHGYGFSGETSQFKSELSAANVKTLALKLNGPYNVTVKAQDTDKVSVDLSGPKELVDNIRFTPEDDRLVLEQQEQKMTWTFFGSNNEVTGTITVPKSLALDMDYAGVVKVNVDGHAGSVKIDGSGATKVTFANSTTVNPDINLSGAGQVQLDKCQGEVSFDISGAGKIETKECTANKVTIRTSGAGQITMNGGTIADLDVRTSGASKISLPKPTGKINQDTSGASKLEYK